MLTKIVAESKLDEEIIAAIFLYRNLLNTSMKYEGFKVLNFQLMYHNKLSPDARPDYDDRINQRTEQIIHKQLSLYFYLKYNFLYNIKDAFQLDYVEAMFESDI